MAEAPKAPNRTRTPDEYGYVLVDKQSFKELIVGIKAVLKKQLKFAHKAVIRVDGFQSGFEGEDLFTETLMPKEWVTLENIHVYFYPTDGRAHGYTDSLSV